MVCVSASHAVGPRFAPLLGHTKDPHKNGTNCLLLGTNALGQEFDSATRLCKDPIVCGTVFALKRPPGINRKNRVLYPGSGFLSSATSPSMQKKY